MSDTNGHSNTGIVVSVRGSVVDARFDTHLPPIFSVLRAGDKKQIVIEVLAQRNAHHVRGIALTPTQGLARHGSTGHRRSIEGAGRQIDSFPDVRRFWKSRSIASQRRTTCSGAQSIEIRRH